MDINKKQAHIRVNIKGIEKAPKTKGSIRTVELDDMALEAINSLIATGLTGLNRVFIDPKSIKEYKYSDGLRKYVWKPTLEKLNISYRYPCQCRHTYASMMLSQGRNPMWVAKQMGHSDWGMIRKIYGRWIDTTEEYETV